MSIGQVPRTLTMKRPPAVSCRGTERLLDHDTSLPTDSDDGQCLCEQRQHTPVTSGDTTLSECRSLASLPKRCCRPSPSLPHNQSIPSPLHNRHRAISRNVTGLVLVGCLLRLRRSVVSSTGAVASNSAGSLRPMTKAVSEGVN